MTDTLRNSLKLEMPVCSTAAVGSSKRPGRSTVPHFNGHRASLMLTPSSVKKQSSEDQICHWWELPQIFVTTNMCLSRLKFCSNKHTFVITKNKKMVMTNIIMLQQKYACRDKSLSWQSFVAKKYFVMTEVLPQRAYFGCDKNYTCGSSHQWYKSDGGFDAVNVISGQESFALNFTSFGCSHTGLLLTNEEGGRLRRGIVTDAHGCPTC